MVAELEAHPHLATESWAQLWVSTMVLASGDQEGVLPKAQMADAYWPEPDQRASPTPHAVHRLQLAITQRAQPCAANLHEGCPALWSRRSLG